MNLKRRVAAIIGAVVLGTFGAVAIESPASAYTYPHLITAGGYCLEVPNSSGAWGEQLRLNYCTGARNQVFNFVDAGFDWGYSIRPAHSGLCLMPGNANLYNSTIIQWGCNGGSRQTWVIASAPSSLILYTTYSRWCLGVDYAYVGAYVTQGDCSGLGRRLTLW